MKGHGNIGARRCAGRARWAAEKIKIHAFCLFLTIHCATIWCTQPHTSFFTRRESPQGDQSEGFFLNNNFLYIFTILYFCIFIYMLHNACAQGEPAGRPNARDFVCLVFLYIIICSVAPRVRAGRARRATSPKDFILLYNYV